MSRALHPLAETEPAVPSPGGQGERRISLLSLVSYEVENDRLIILVLGIASRGGVYR